MKILHISTQDFGGAGKAAYRLHIGLKSIGVESKMLVLHRSSKDKDVVQFGQCGSIAIRMWKKMVAKFISQRLNAYRNTRSQDAGLFSDDRTKYSIGNYPLVRQADIITLRWIAFMVDYTEFFRKLKTKPIVWRLADMNPFTGGCHCAGDCKKYEIGCGACPQLGSKDRQDLSRMIFERKKKAYKDTDINIVTPSKWLADRVRGSELFKNHKIYTIPSGVPTTVFKKREKQYSRDLFNLPQDKFLILYAAGYNAKYKGFKYLIEALTLLRNKSNAHNFALVIVGNVEDAVYKDAGFPVYFLDYIQDETALSCCYSSADIFVAPYLEDSLPNTVLESFACGIPVVGFDAGGIPELIKPHQTGLLAQVKNSEELANQIKWMMTHPLERQETGKNAHQLIEQEYTLEIQARRYLELYESLLNAK